MKNYPNQINVTFANCDKEPINLIGRIQPHGIMLVIDSNYIVTQASTNVDQLLGLSHKEIIGKPLAVIPAIAEITDLESWLQAPNGCKALEINKTPYLAIAHQSENLIVIEIEPDTRVENEQNLFSSLTSLQEEMAKVKTVQLLYQLVTDAVQALIDYDRVMLFKFDEEWNGEVVAERIKPGIKSFLHHHFPPNDIPAQAREMMLQKPVRQIPDVTAEGVFLFPYLPVGQHTPTSLILSELRNPSELHLEYLMNMKVGATLTTSIVVNGKLWGIIAGQHSKPVFISWKYRKMCEALANTFAREIILKTTDEERLVARIYQEVNDSLLQQILEKQDVIEGLFYSTYSPLDITQASAVIMFIEGKILQRGKTPPLAFSRELRDWFFAHLAEEIWVTNHLVQYYPAAKKHANLASGVMIMRLSKSNNDCLIWYKPEIPVERIWAGNPNEKNPYRGQEDLLLSPRQSFEKWTELAKYYSEKWDASEIGSAKVLKRDIMESTLAVSKKLKLLNQELETALREEQQLVAELQAIEEELAQTQEFQEEIIQQLHKGGSGFAENQGSIGSYANFMLDKNLCIQSYNKAGQQILEYLHGHKLSKGDNILDFIPESQRNDFEEKVEKAVEGQSWRQERKASYENRMVWIYEHFYPIYDRHGKIKAVAYDFLDITDRKVAYEFVQNLAMIAKNTINGVVITNEYGEVEWINQGFTRITGYTLPEVYGKKPGTLLQGKQTSTETVSTMKQAISRFESFAVEVVNYQKNGSLYWNKLQAQPFISASGEKKYFAIQSDITEIKRSQEDIEKLNRRLKLATDIGRITWWEICLDTNEVSTDEKLKDLLGLPENPKSLGALIKKIHPNDRRMAFSLFKTCFKGNKVFEATFRLKRNSKKYLWTYNRGVVIEKEGMLLLSGTLQDVHEWKITQEDIKRQNIQLTKTNKELDSFVYSVSHDLRAPIASSLGLLKIMEMEENLETIKSYLELQERSLNKLDNFIREIVDFSRNARTTLKTAPIDFQSLINEVLESISYWHGFEQVIKEIDIQEDSPFFSDPNRISIILNNLISNSIRYRDTRKVSKVNISVRHYETGVQISVQDNGIGIKKDHLPHIFEMFYRATDRQNGSGLGLYILNETVERLNGKVVVSSEYGQGSNFKVFLPNNTPMK